MHIPKTDAWLDSLLAEDCPCLDLTTELLDIADNSGLMRFSSKADCVLSGVEEAELLLRKCGLEARRSAANGDRLSGGEVFLEAWGCAAGLHRAWKICQTVLEYMTGIASRAAHMTACARTANPQVQVAVTRKNFPGAKGMSLEAAINGGATVHRQNLSDSILIFEQHRVFMEEGPQQSIRALASMMDKLRRHSPERKIVAEVERLEDALLLAEVGLDVVQCEKFSCEKLAETVGALRAVHPGIVILAAGGINGENASQYASTGVDVLVTSWPYFGKPADIRVSMEQTGRANL